MGTFNANVTTHLRGGILPEFDRYKSIYGVTAIVFDAPDCPHDVIMGRDLLNDLKMELNFNQGHIKWMDKIALMKKPNHWQNHTNWSLALDPGSLDVYDEDPTEPDDAFILDAKYEATSGSEVAQKQEHLTPEQRQQLAAALSVSHII